MKVSVIQLGYDDRETVEARPARVVSLVEAQAGHDLVVLPELWPAGGFDYRHWNERAEPVDGPVATALSAAAATAGVTLHGGSFIERADPVELGGRGLWNTSVVFGPDGALLVAGSSLTVMSGLRFVRRAAQGGTPIVIVNRGVTRGDPLASYRLDVGCSEFLGDLVRQSLKLSGRARADNFSDPRLTGDR